MNVVSIFAAMLSVVGCKNPAQDSTDYYIKNLNWNSVQLTPTYFHQLMLSKEAQKIVGNIKDTLETARKLLNEIDKKDKSVFIHVILSKIFEPGNNRFSESYTYSHDTIALVNYSYNNLVWQFYSDEKEFKVSQGAIKKIKDHWEKKVISLLAFTQGLTQDSVDYYIKNLSWESLFITPTYVSQLILRKDAERLVSAKNDKTVKKLFSEISKETKTVAIHMILSKMFEPQNDKIEGKYIYKNNSVAFVNYSYNTPAWQYNVGEGKYTIEPGEIIKIRDYWEKKLPLDRNMSGKHSTPVKCKNAFVSK